MGQKLRSADGRGIKEVKTMTNRERADKWHEIMYLLNDVYYRKTTTLDKKVLIAHYLVFATETWLMYLDKALRGK